MLVRELAERDAVHVLHPKDRLVLVANGEGAKAALAQEAVDTPPRALFDGCGALALGAGGISFFYSCYQHTKPEECLKNPCFQGFFVISSLDT